MNILIKLKQMGKRVIIIYILQRNDIFKLSVDEKIDSTYYKQVMRGKKEKLEFFAFNCNIEKESISINKQIELEF
jgi:DNA-binding sugar fermentation-stimulating protein